MSILDYVDKELTIVEWDARNTYEGYYPNGNVVASPAPPPPANFQRYQPPAPMKIIINTIAATEMYSLECIGAHPERAWERATKRLCYLPSSDSMLGVDVDENGAYAVSLGEGSQAGGEITFSFAFEETSGDPTSTILIGHVRV